MELLINEIGLQSTNVEPNQNNNLQIFKNQKFGAVRTVIKNNEVWFVLKDILSILEINNITDVKKRLNEKGLDKIELLTKGGIQEVFIVNESNLYKCIIRSNKPEAILFEDWITSEVLPSIRKNGMYAIEVTIDKMVNNPDFTIALLQKLKQEKELRIKVEKEKELLVHSDKTYLASEIAKELGLSSASELNMILKNKGIQYKANKTWLLYSQYSKLGYISNKNEILDNGKMVYNRRFTGIGREFILGLMNEENKLID